MNRNVRRLFRKNSIIHQGQCDGSIFFIVLVVCIVAIYSFLFDEESINDVSNTTLQVAVENCDLETVKSLVKNSTNTGDVSNIGEKALRYSAEEGCLEIVKFLLDEGANINATSGALHHAAEGGQLDVVKLLLKSGANPHIRNWKGQTAKTIAIKRSSYHGSKKSYREIIDLLYDAEKQYKLEK